MVRMNLMPWRERRRADAVRRFHLILLATLVVALGAMLTLDQLARARLAQQLATTAGHREALSRFVDDQSLIGKLQGERDALLVQQAALSRLRGAQAPLVELLQGMERAMPSGAQLTELSVKDRQLRLAGLAASASVVAQLMRDLEAMGVVTGLELVFLRNQAAGDEFLLNARLPVGWS